MTPPDAGVHFSVQKYPKTMGELKIFGDLANDLEEGQWQGPDVDPDMLLLEAPGGGLEEAWVIDSFHGCLFSLEGFADHRGQSVEELRGKLREVRIGDAGDGTGDGVNGVDTVSTDELDADLDQGTVRKTIRGLDQGAVAAIREVTGASSDSEAIRKAVVLAKDALVTD